MSLNRQKETQNGKEKEEGRGMLSSPTLFDELEAFSRMISKPLMSWPVFHPRLLASFMNGYTSPNCICKGQIALDNLISEIPESNVLEHEFECPVHGTVSLTYRVSISRSDLVKKREALREEIDKEFDEKLSQEEKEALLSVRLGKWMDSEGYTR